MKLRGIVFISAVDWNFLKQRVHHLAVGLAAAGLKVLFIENTGVRTPRLSDIPRVLQRLRVAFAAGTRGKGEPLPLNVEVYSPLVLPFPYFGPAVAYNFRILKRAVAGFLGRHNLQPQEAILFSYLATPVVLQLAKTFCWDKVVYDVVSDPKLVEPRLAPFERQFLQRADVTLFASATLLEQYWNITRNPVLFRDGFNTELLEAKAEIPPEVAKLPRPRLLYLGGINRKLWTEAIQALARAMPDASIILVGPVAPGEVTLPQLPNIYWFPPVKHYTDLAGYLKAADVGLIPYRPDPYAGAMQPAKLNEYLVFGLPVVATATEELRRLADESPEKMFYLAETLEAFRNAVCLAIAENAVEPMVRRQKISEDNKWLNRVKELIAVLS
ncbi:MAG: glycosyltransferase [Thermoanaerobacter sp.]|nr:glycosyltransferase [Thermoanaerobacter sp.]